jgi:sialate O-acetylesterase
MLDALAAASRPQVLTISGKNRLQVEDVLVGEVWLGSGQSNMEMQVKGEEHGAVDHADEEIAKATFPEIRVFQYYTPYSIYDVRTPPNAPLADRPGRWRICSPGTVADFSAMAYFIARGLHVRLGTPVGILTAAVGGTPIEAWTSRESQVPVQELAPLLADWTSRLTNYDAASEQSLFLERKKQWLKTRSEAVKAGTPVPKAPAPFKNLAVMAPGCLFNSEIAPLIPYTLRGCVWYQGERNAAGPFTGLYGLQLQTMIKDWRAHWGSAFYFAWVQLPGFQKPQRLPSEPTGWGVSVREGQLKAMSVPKTGMAVTIDLGGEKAGHPTNKLAFAERVLPLLLHDVYGKDMPVFCGPILRSARRDGGKMVIQFDHGQGLKAADGSLKGFAIAGADRKFVWGEAAVDGDKAVVSSKEVMAPEAVRYGWAGNPIGNLVNGGGFPASPFRTDDWQEAKPAAQR